MEETSTNNLWITNGIFVVFCHLSTVIGLLWFVERLHPYTLILSALLWQLACFGITVGYHRLWSHRSFTASKTARIALAIMGSSAFQGSIKWWVQRHRLHHRFTDTDDDPYDATKGFWYSHITWIFQKPHLKKLSLLDINDLKSDPIVMFQHKYYVPLALLTGIILPTLICGLWEDFTGGYFIAALGVRILVWHCTFAINSFAHLIGSQDYAIGRTPRGNLLLALMTAGEGHHNFHHEFPKDYRNGWMWHHYDPSKWLIYIGERIGLCSKLFITPIEDIRKSILVTRLLKSNNNSFAESIINNEPHSSKLPVWNLASLQDAIQRNIDNRYLFMLVDGFILELSKFANVHPGGLSLLRAYSLKCTNEIKDATDAFYKLYNYHSVAAKIKMSTLRIAHFKIA